MRARRATVERVSAINRPDDVSALAVAKIAEDDGIGRRECDRLRLLNDNRWRRQCGGALFPRLDGPKCLHSLLWNPGTPLLAFQPESVKFTDGCVARDAATHDRGDLRRGFSLSPKRRQYLDLLIRPAIDEFSRRVSHPTTPESGRSSEEAARSSEEAARSAASAAPVKSFPIGVRAST